MRRWVLLSLIGLSLSCAKRHDFPDPFTQGWQNDAGISVAELEQRLRQTPKPPTVNVAVGVTTTGIVGMPLDGGRTWSYASRPDVLPTIAGPLVLFSAGGKLVALDAATGAPRYETGCEGYRLKGAGDDGTTTVAILGGGAKSLLLILDHRGSVLNRIETDTPLGRPAARGGVAFVPWAGQYVTALDMKTGDEVARILTRELTSQALTVNGELFFGQMAVLHFDDRIRFATTSQARRAVLPSRELPGKPIWLDPGAEIPALSMGARPKIRVYASPTFHAGKVGFASDRFLATYFRTVMAFDAKTAELSWARALTDPVIGGDAASSGFVLCTAGGRVVRIGAAGGDAGKSELGVPLTSCVVEASSFTVPAGTAPKPLADQIAEALSALDPKMAAAQRFLLTELGRLDDPGVTKTLIGLCTNARVPPDVRSHARTELAAQRTGADYMLEALEKRYDFLSGELLPPPVGPLSDALAAMGDKRAAPLLARHLNDPATTTADVEHAAKALSELAGEGEVPALRTFFALYRATADEPAMIKAVISVARALLKSTDAEARQLIAAAARDPLTQTDIARALLELGA